MGDKLTNEDKKFVKELIETGNQTQSAKKAYGYEDDNVAGVMAHRKLRNVKIQNAIQSLADRIPDDKIVEKHLSLFEQKQVEYFTFPKKMTDAEVEDKVNRAGFEVITISEGEKGKYAFYSIPNANAIKSALDMSYRIKGSYSDDKEKNINILMPVLVKFLDKQDAETNETSDNGNTD